MQQPTDKGWCKKCRLPVRNDGFDWYHEDTGKYLAYTKDGSVDHAAEPGGRSPKKGKPKK